MKLIEFVVFVMYEKLLDNVKNQFNKSTRTNAELKDKLHQLFQDNIAEYEKYEMWYGEDKPFIHMDAKDKYEHYVIENFKKRMYGEDYAIKEFKSIYSCNTNENSTKTSQTIQQEFSTS